MLNARNLWVESINTKFNSQARLRLFCFPYAGGSASIFHSWPITLPSTVEICPIQLPGRENRLREPLFTLLAPLIQTLSKVLSPYMDMPFAFFGHSLGALISFELARYLYKQGYYSPKHLFVSAHRAPQIPHTHPPIHQLPEAAFIEELRRLNGTPEQVLQHTELMQLMLPILRADFAIYETYNYTPEEPLDCSISTFGGLQDKGIHYDHLLAWHDQTTSSYKIHMFPNDHFFIHSDKELLLQALSEDLIELINQIISDE